MPIALDVDARGVTASRLRHFRGERPFRPGLAAELPALLVVMLPLLVRQGFEWLRAPAVAVLLFEVLLNATSMFSHGNVKLPAGVDRLLRTAGQGSVAAVVAVLDAGSQHPVCDGRHLIVELFIMRLKNNSHAAAA